MFSSSILKKCPLCSRLSSGLKAFLCRLIGNRVNCRCINQRTSKDVKRVNKINAAAPGCACEKHRMSKHSPRTVEESEQLARFVFSPMHVNRKTGEIMPSIFSHVHEKGCSIQRDSVAGTNEIGKFVESFLSNKSDRAWVGVLTSPCQNVRGIRVETDARGVCVYDTAEPGNPAHAEMCQTQYVIGDADRLELRNKLLAAFGDGVVIKPQEYRTGTVLAALPQELRARPLPHRAK